MKYPEFLKPNGTIGMIAPSFGCTIEPYRSAFGSALEAFHTKGYRTKLGANVYEDCGIGISSTPERCGREVMDFYLSTDTDVLISCGGGELMCEDLEYIDFQALREARPKWFMGYSDNTNLTFLLTTLCDTASIYGPCAPAFGMQPWHPALDDAFGILTGATADAAGNTVTVHGYDRYEKEAKKDAEHPLEPYNVTEPVRRKCFPGGDAAFEGRLIGGCLDILVNLKGTRFDRVNEFLDRYDGDGIVWFFEACDLNMFSIRRAVWQMDMAGWFRNTKGLLVGRPYHNGETEFGLDQYHAVTDLLGKYDFPIIMDLDIGHVPPMMPLIVGSYAKAFLKGNEFSLRMELR